MILHVDPAGPWWVAAGAALILVLHIAGGSVAIVAGTLAAVARKGGPLHRRAGNVFFAAMVLMAAIGAAVAPFLPARISTVAAGLTLYLVASGWLTVRRKPGGTGAGEIGAMLAGVGTLGLAIALILIAARNPDGRIDGDPPHILYLFAAVAAIALAGDLRTILGGRAKGPARITRHLWRMCFAFFVATGSFFLGQQQVMPAWMQGSPWLFLPALAPLGLMAYWLIRQRIARKTPATQPAH